MQARRRAQRPDPAVIFAGVPRQPRDVHAALFALETVARRLRDAGDARAVFPDVYAIITSRVAAGVRNEPGAPRFREPEAISRLDGLFAERYLDWLDRSLRGQPLDSAAWRLACEYAERGLTLPAQDAMLGINAHINFDLAQGLCDNIEALGHGRDAAMLARYKHDHDAVNAILRGAVRDCLALLVERYGCRFTELLVRYDRCQSALCEGLLVAFARWRETVWRDALELLAAPAGPARQRVLARTDRASGRIALGFCAGNMAVALGQPWLPGPARGVLARVGGSLRSDAGY